MTAVSDNWRDDKLDRKQCADYLTNYLTKRFALAAQAGRPDSLVLNISANWGFGKTFFVNAWMKDLLHSKYPVVYFDAWANDFSDDPLVGFISEMNEALSEHFKRMPVVQRHVDEAFAVGRRLIKPLGMSVAAVLAKQLAGCSLDQLKGYFSDTADDASTLDIEHQGAGDKEGEGVASVIAQCAEVAVKEHASKKETIATFRKRLARLIKELEKKASVQLPMFVFIDELDRCRPSYAIELLEAIKHLFGVGGIYFVASTNLDQLGHSIKAVYGEQFDSEQYLKRFFDQEYLLPAPEHSRYTSMLFERYSLDKFGNYVTPVVGRVYGDTPVYQAIFTEFALAFGMSLRDQEQVAVSLQAVILSWPNGEVMHLPLILFYLMLKQRSSVLYEEVGRKEFGQEDFARRLKEVFEVNRSIVHQIRNGEREAIAAYSLVLEYLRNRWKTSSNFNRLNLNTLSLSDRIALALIDGQLHNERANDVPFTISEYYGRVSRAGQLTMARRSVM